MILIVILYRHDRLALTRVLQSWQCNAMCIAIQLNGNAALHCTLTLFLLAQKIALRTTTLILHFWHITSQLPDSNHRLRRRERGNKMQEIHKNSMHSAFHFHCFALPANLHNWLGDLTWTGSKQLVTQNNRNFKYAVQKFDTFLVELTGIHGTLQPWSLAWRPPVCREYADMAETLCVLLFISSVDSHRK